eukprot:2565694-Pyramimonas_sp.AAC.1
MGRLDEFLARLVEKAEAKRRAEQGAQDTDSDAGCESSSDDEPSEQGKGGNNGASVYGSKAYWEDRYEDGVVGHTTAKGELSNEWCAWLLSFLCRQSASDSAVRGTKGTSRIGKGRSLNNGLCSCAQ